MSEPPYFEYCFPEESRSDRNFSLYMALMEKASRTPTKATPEKHHIVPREWLSWRFPNFNFDTEDESNVVYLSVRDKLLAMQYVVLLVHDYGDSTTYKRLTEAISRRYHLGKYAFWLNPYIDRETMSLLVEKRRQELLGKKKKYSDDYLLKCSEILYSEKDKDVAFRRIQSELGFSFSKRTLFDQLRKRFGRV